MIGVARAGPDRDGPFVVAFKALLYGAAIVLYLAQISSLHGIAAALAGALLGMGLAALAHRAGLRLAVSVVVALAGVALAAGAGAWALSARTPAETLGIRGSLLLADGLIFGPGALFVVFLLRRLSLARRSFALLEVLFVAGGVVVLLADHRNRMLHRPRFFSDWVWSVGQDPATLLAGVGVALTILSIFLFLRGQRLLKLVTSLTLLLALGTAYFLFADIRMTAIKPQDALGLSGKGDKGKGKGGKGGGGVSDNPFKDDYSSNQPPTPVAIAVLRDDFAPRNNIIYFRQSVLSRFNGTRLVRDEGGARDRDVLSQFPRERPVEARSGQSPGDHTVVPSTMYLLVDHPQPIGLGHPRKYALVKNPNPQQFVAAYDAVSSVLSVPTQRLLGRRSIPGGWDKARQGHYLSHPPDPRYRTLADIIVRDVDPRFAGDDLARAYAIKRYLEREGFYTLRSSHKDDRDPAASFLFGSMRGYCVHFAHAAAYLLRSQGIAARVALGYAVQTTKRGGGSSVLVMADRAHAWPEIHLVGIGWVTFDIYPERTDMPPPTMVDYDLEKLLGELARSDKTAGLRPDGKPFEIPWAVIGAVSLASLMGLLLLAYLIKGYRRLAPRLRPAAYPRLAYVAVLDRLSDLGVRRRHGETRERHAARLRELTPSFDSLTRLHLSMALGAGGSGPGRGAEVARLEAQVLAELRGAVHPARRALAVLNPIGWILTR